MDSPTPGDLVKIATGGPEFDAIVFDTPSKSKVVVAVVDANRGPVFRTVNPKTLLERTEEGPDDHALHLLIRRTPVPSHSASRGGTRGGRAREGHTRGATHRPTGK
jgi:hypothetical protein